jgi:hypothetical protein
VEISVAETHHIDAAPDQAPGKLNFAAPAPTTFSLAYHSAKNGSIFDAVPAPGREIRLRKPALQNWLRCLIECIIGSVCILCCILDNVLYTKCPSAKGVAYI